MNKDEMIFRDALQMDFMKFTNQVMLSYFLKMHFRNPYGELDRMLEVWEERIKIFRTNSLKASAEEHEMDEDVAEILTKLHEDFDREATLKDMKEGIRTAIYESMRQII